MPKIFKKKHNNKYNLHIEKEDVLRFLDKQPESSIDIIVTDPAYSGMNNHLSLGKGRIIGKYSDKGKVNGKWFSEFEDREDNYRNFLSLCQKSLKKDGHLYIMFDSFSMLSLGPIVREYFDVKNIISWDKVNMGMGHYFRRRHEFIIFATNKNSRNISSRSFPDIWRIKRLHNAKYPTQKPVEIFDIMLSASAKKGDVVCDPFLGSGSSAISAINNHCNFVGCDISDKSIKTSKDRIEVYIKMGEDSCQPKSCIPDGEKKFW
jgi:site-specific DNA-methyltransferase (adenine-specific)